MSVCTFMPYLCNIFIQILHLSCNVAVRFSFFYSVSFQWRHKRWKEQHWWCKVSAGHWHTALLSHPNTGCHVWFQIKCEHAHFITDYVWFISMLVCLTGGFVCVRCVLCVLCQCLPVCVCVCVCLGAIPELVSLKLVSLWWMFRAARLSKLIPPPLK